MAWYELLECAGGGRQRLGKTRDLNDDAVATLNRGQVATTRRWWTCAAPAVTGPTVGGAIAAGLAVVGASDESSARGGSVSVDVEAANELLSMDTWDSDEADRAADCLRAAIDEAEQLRAENNSLQERCDALTSMRDSTVYAKTKLRAELARSAPVVEAAKAYVDWLRSNDDAESGSGPLEAAVDALREGT